MPVPSPIRFAVLQRALVELVGSFVPAPASVLWGWQQHHRDASAALRIEIRHTLGPVSLGSTGRGQGYNAPDDAAITVASAEIDRRYFAAINGVEAFTDYQALDTAATIRGRLLTAINLVASDAGVAASSSGAASILLTPIVAGGLYALQLAGPLTASLGSTEPYRLKAVTKSITLEVQAYVRRTSAAALSLHNGAVDALARVQTGFEREAALERLDRDGFSIASMSPPVDLTALSGGEIESRAAFDLTLHTPSVDFEPREVIERVAGSILLSEPANTVTLVEIVAP